MSGIKIPALSGFTLLQMAIICLILGLMAATAANTYHLYVRKTQMGTSSSRVAAIQTAVQNFFKDHGYIPCAADPAQPETSATFGVELPGLCTGGNIGGTIDVPGQGTAGHVRIGAVPVRTLGIDDSYIVNAYGNEFFYAVTESLTSKGATPLAPVVLTGTTDGSIDVCDGSAASCDAGHSVLDGTTIPAPPGGAVLPIDGCVGQTAPDYMPPVFPTANVERYALYLVIDPGQSGLGTHNTSGTLISACVAGTKDYQNCSGGGGISIFRGGQYQCVQNEQGYYIYTYTPAASYSDQ